MNTFSDRFQAGHRSLRRPLAVFDRQLRTFEQGRMPDMLLMRDILDYLNNYTTVNHNTYESRLINALAKAEPRFASARLILTTEHDMITALGERCKEVVEAIIAGTVLARSALLRPGRRYLRMYRTHLRRERAYLHRHGRGIVNKGISNRLQPPALTGTLGRFSDVNTRIAQAATSRRHDETGRLVCSACVATEAAFAANPHP